ncbi:TetR/AcrR family transcriptional regulator [Phaeobacter gallaeciensis]|uniref:TetR/AcrR family transcriptional regulator n=2 Tax=Roseobacteraceae TaxID=2854170 RepID=A0A366X2P9_9RHOB|nr:MULTISPECIES: TetR family transcriptional regulator [Roseobacteraceae]MBT3143268.1 TetR family transcriptional regulator [Falsiruegeria litorea]MBT8167532.1 TetR family transcriptional regulator [Falsiruegeria litorea]RBW57920.1 TetR/AcrR family transcriptional regulator [Phaeobacter gallaeciensis]
MRPNKRDELVRKALQVFYRDGFHATGMDKLVTETGVSKTSMYKHFRTKEELIVAALQLRDESFRAWFLDRIQELSDTPEGQLMAGFDALGEWFAEDGYRGCMFIKAGAEYQEKSHPIHQQAAGHKQALLDHFIRLATEAGTKDPEALGSQILLLKEGAIVSSVLLNSCKPAQDAKEAARVLLDHALAK